MQDIKQIQSVTGHLLAAVGRAFVKIVASFLGFAAIGAAAIEGTAFFNQQGSLNTLDHIAAGAFALVLGYAAGLTVAVTEAIRALIDAGKEAGKEVVNVEKTISTDAGNLVKTAEGEIQKLEHH